MAWRSSAAAGMVCFGAMVVVGATSDSKVVSMAGFVEVSPLREARRSFLSTSDIYAITVSGQREAGERRTGGIFCSVAIFM